MKTQDNQDKQVATTSQLSTASLAIFYNRPAKKNISEVFECEAPSLANVRKALGADLTKAFLAGVFSDIARFFNVKQGLTEQGLLVLVDIVMEEFYFLNIEDLKIFKKHCFLQKYGKVYERLDASLLLEWLQAYVSQRFDEAEKVSLNEHKKLKNI